MFFFLRVSLCHGTFWFFLLYDFFLLHVFGASRFFDGLLAENFLLAGFIVFVTFKVCFRAFFCLSLFYIIVRLPVVHFFRTLVLVYRKQTRLFAGHG